MSKREQREGMVDSLFDGFAQAIEDIRHKLVEEGWFGRQVTGTTVTPEPSDWRGEEPVTREDVYGGDRVSTRPSFDEQWAAHRRTDPPDAPEKSYDRGIDL